MSAPLASDEIGAIAVCEINLPERRNALDAGLCEALITELERLDGSDRVRCIVLAGTNEAFATGAEARLLAEGRPGEAPDRAPGSFWKRLAAVETPIVAAVSGWVLGDGLELALSCDMIVAADGTQFGQPEVTLGMTPGGGTMRRLPRAIGKQRAMELVLTGRRFSAEQALAWGLVNQVSPKAGWLEAAKALAEAVAAGAPIAVRLAKRAMLDAERSTLDADLEIERELLERTLATEDRIEGMSAAIEGRRPDFRSR